MNDPKRLLDSGTALEGRLLGSAIGDAPRKGLDRRVQVALGIGSVALGTGTASTTAAAASKAAPYLFSVGIAKWAGILALGTGTIVGAAAIHRHASAPIVPQVEGRSVPRPPLPRVPVSDIPPPPPVVPAAEPPVMAPRPSQPGAGSAPRVNAPSGLGAVESRTPPLAAELELLDRAHEALGAGDTQGALVWLDRRDLELEGAGSLAPEALALRVEAYAMRHDGVKVAELGRAFLSRYPGHPQAPRVAAFVHSAASSP